MVQWRLIPFLETSGAIQMALDNWLLEQHRMGHLPPILRFYGWSPIAVSLGYHQHRYPPAWHSLDWQGQSVDIIRRPSGGRAVLHQGDLTYAIILSSHHLPNPPKRSEIYQRLCQFLIKGFQRLNVALEYGLAGRGYIHNPNCFGTATAADLVLANGTKVIGSAQLRRGDTILQHGSIRITPDPLLFQQVFGQPAIVPTLTQWSALPAFAVDSDYETIRNTMMDVFTVAACECFEMDYNVQPLSLNEWNRVVAQSHKWHKPAQGT